MIRASTPTLRAMARNYLDKSHVFDNLDAEQLDAAADELDQLRLIQPTRYVDENDLNGRIDREKNILRLAGEIIARNLTLNNALYSGNVREHQEATWKLRILEEFRDLLITKNYSYADLNNWVFRQFVIEHGSVSTHYNAVELEMLATLARAYFV